jgi:hypothetical protein
MSRTTLAALALLAAPWAMADEATVWEGLVSGCFAGLPDFSTTAAALGARGWQIGPGASATESEARKSNVNVFINRGDSFNSPGCSVLSGDVPIPAAEALLEAQLDRGFAGKWKSAPGYGGSKSWVVPGQGASLVMYVLGGGNSGDGPGSGISLSVRKDK